MLNELTDDYRVIFADIGCKLEEAAELILIRADVHGCTREDVTWTDKNRESYTVDELVDVVHTCQGIPFRLIDVVAGEH